MARKHAIKGASSAYRWMACPGSVGLIRSLPEELRGQTSSYAAEGQAAHNLAADCLSEGIDAGDRVDSTSPDDSGVLHVVTEEMADAVQVYLDDVCAQRERLPSAKAMVEQRFDLGWLRPGMFGTADHVLVEPFGELVVHDYKHGAGVVVEVEWNAQQMYYALGALAEAGGPDDVDSVTIRVVQPRARHKDGPVRSWTISADALWAWREDLAVAADRADAPDAELCAGEWCRFCPAQSACPAMRQLVQSTAAIEFGGESLDPERDMPALPDPANPAALATALNAIPVIDAWCRAVEGTALHLLERGQNVPRYKLVRKRATRRWRDEEELAKALKRRKGVRKADYVQEKLRSPAQLEKVKAIGKDFVSKHAEKPEGGLAIAHESDPREAVPPPAIAEFAEEPPNTSSGEAVGALAEGSTGESPEDEPDFLS